MERSDWCTDERWNSFQFIIWETSLILGIYGLSRVLGSHLDQKYERKDVGTLTGSVRLYPQIVNSHTA